MKVMTTFQAMKDAIGNLLPDNLLLAALNSIIHNDAAHNLDHILRVVTLGNQLCDKVETLTVTQRQMVLAGCLMHDLGCRYDRDTHHIISYGLAFEYCEKYAAGIFTVDEVRIIAQSCMQHRGSWGRKGEPPRDNIICDLVALADRGLWDKYEYVKRSVQFHLSREGEDNLPNVRKEVMLHVPDKFGHQGYVWAEYPALGRSLYREEIANFIEFAENPRKIEAMIDAIFAELKLYR